MTMDLTDLDTRGFVVVRGFLDADDLAALRGDVATAPSTGNALYPLRSPSPQAIGLVRDRLGPLLERVNAETSLGVDRVVGGSYFSTGIEAGIDFPWHQDHESWFSHQNHHDYLNVYVPVVKPDVTRSNLCVLPFDVLARQEPRIHRMLVGGGASRLCPIGKRWFVVDDGTGRVRTMRTDPDSMAETPQLAAGDLQLMRGDIIHRTQDTSTARVALSVRVASTATTVSRRDLACGSIAKAHMMSVNARGYRKMFHAFDEAGTDELTWGDLTARVEAMDDPAWVRRRVFLRELLREKRRASSLASFAVTAPLTLGVRGMEVAQQRVRRRSAPVSA